MFRVQILFSLFIYKPYDSQFIFLFFFFHTTGKLINDYF